MTLPLLAQLRHAATDADRAALLLRLPDVVVARDALLLSTICTAALFREGITYVACRSAVLAAVRDGEGLLPPEVAMPMTASRLRLVAIARGEP